MTNNDLIKKYLTSEEQEQLHHGVAEEVTKIHRGCASGAGRKPKLDNALKLQVRVSEEEKAFLKYAREHKLDYNKLMQG
ncbi:hypothetical protein tpqmel_0028 [Candidatus Gastranaerophilus sp. (ex Termes propinquus)]|nr:hypothetical protein tpqmel_0028 [Candidatus Gastranaerophilus sp. (ex Termes propinquus)]